MEVDGLASVAGSGDVRYLERLLHSGADPNERSTNDLTPLHTASKEGHSDCVRLLLAFGANPKLLNMNKENPLHFAVRANQCDILKILLKNREEKEKKLLVNRKNDGGLTPALCVY